ncbi:MAG: tail completion protein gp17 [Thermoguttaceae bacterium]
MNLAQVIHQRWAEATTLNDLLPASRVYTGLSFDPSRPYALISKENQRPQTYHSDGSAIDAVGLRIRVVHDEYDAGAEIVNQVKIVFDRTAFDLAGSDKVLNIERTNDTERQNNDGVWEFSIDFKCTVFLNVGV